MHLSPEFLLQHLQHFIKNSIKIKQIHSLLITTNYLITTPNPWTTTLLYNTLIRGYLNIQNPQTTFLLFTQMLSHNIPPNSYTFPSLTKAVVYVSSYVTTPFPIDKPIYTQALKRGVLADPFVKTSFINMYARCGCLLYARKVFDEMSDPCLVSCNAMLDGYCKNADMSNAVLFFEWMFVKDVYSWTSIISGYGKIGCHENALRCFKRMIVESCWGDCMVKPNEATYVSVLSASAGCVGIQGLLGGKQIHGYIIKNEDRISAFVGTALISLYGKMGELEYAIKVFENMGNREVCTWNAMINSLASNGKEKVALDMFDKMKLRGWRPNEITFVVVLTACARTNLVNFGLDIFNSMLPQFGVVPIMEHYGCVVDLLGRAGLLEEAKDFVKRMPFKPDVSVLGALLGACKLHGDVELGNEVAKNLVELQPQRYGQYILLSSIYAEAEKWDHANSLRKFMVGSGIQKPPAHSTVNAM